MDDMRNRYRVARRDYSLPPDQTPPTPQPAASVHDSLRGAYQPPPGAARSEPEPTQQPIQRQPPPVHHVKPRKPKKKLKKFVISAIILLILAGGGLYAYPKYVSANPFSADIQTNAGFSLLYPQKLPAGYTIDKTSIKLSNGVVIYAATKGDLRIVFTLQKVPDSFDFATFYKQELSNSQQYDTPYGQAVIGKNNDRFLGSLTSGSSWLLLSDNNPSITIDDLSLVMTHLKKY